MAGAGAQIILYGAWTSTIRKLNHMSTYGPKAVQYAIRDEAMYFYREVVKSFRTQQEGKWRPIHPITRAMRKASSGLTGRAKAGGTKAMVATGALRKSVTMTPKGPYTYYVGVNRSSKRANIAAIHETGYAVIPITDKMRAFFRYLFWKGVIPFPFPAPNKKYIVIPRRSFIADTFKRTSKGQKARVLKRYQMHMMGVGAKGQRAATE
jgi:hypothetical protein